LGQAPGSSYKFDGDARFRVDPQNPVSGAEKEFAITRFRKAAELTGPGRGFRNNFLDEHR
jgi:hypothetical protein